jgi:hypothetical protein
MRRLPSAAILGIGAFSGAMAVWLNQHAGVPLVDAASCPGALELTAALAAAVRPTTPIAGTLVAAGHVAMFLAAAMSTLAVWRFTQSIVASATVGIAMAASPLLLPSLAPPSAVALAVAAATWWAASVNRRGIGVFAGLICASAIAPSLGLPTALLCGALARRHGRWQALAAAGICIVITAGAVLATPPLPGHTPMAEALRCVVPSQPNVSAFGDALSFVLGGIGPLALSFAALGLFAFAIDRPMHGRVAERILDRGMLAYGWPAAACLSILLSPSDPLRTLAPVLIGFWVLVGRGIADTVNRPGFGGFRRSAAALLPLVLVGVVLQTKLRPPSDADEVPQPLGHERLTQRDFRALLSQLPPDSALVAEDAITDVILRSVSRSLLHAQVMLDVVPATESGLASTSRSNRVFALPRTQRKLQTRGVRFTEGLAPAVPGVAEVAEVVPCTIARSDWHTAPSAQGATRLALVSDAEAARGPMAVYLGGPAPVDVTPVDWAPLSRRGFFTHRYDLSRPAEREDLAREVANDAAPPGDAALTAAYVTRTELWRVPGAAHDLVVEVSSPPASALIEQLPRATGTVRLCRVFPFALRPMAIAAGGFTLIRK